MGKYTRSELQSWLIGKATSAPGYRKNILYNIDRARDTTGIGRLYFFSYDPKTKEKLLAYDKFPLALPIERYTDGFLALNLHWLSINERIALLSRLAEFKNNKRNDETTRLKLSYNLLNSTKRLSTDIRPCIKRYLFSYVRSRFIEITSDEWDKAAQLPVEIMITNTKKRRP